ncbi:hypothetical protein AB0O87_03450 [Microbacterium sp. NPDC076768]|uniref:hypothetical protein n=1 Tax=Microbacterium sp. NPDC076768 TaxID=3154858 RepID=UPI0034216F06
MNEVWEAIAAMATVGAVITSVAFGVFEGFRARRDRRELISLRASTEAAAAAAAEAERVAVASLVTAWVADTYAYDTAASSYVRTVTLHIANESNEPVVNVAVGVYLGDEARLIGPLSTPALIPVIPPRREFKWDITTGVRAYDDNADPRVAISFTDSRQKRWRRLLDGTLADPDEQDTFRSALDEPELAIAQTGAVDRYRNPMAVAYAFAEELWADPASFDLQSFRTLLDPLAEGWRGSWDNARIDQLRELLQDFSNLAALTWYSSPRVAYARLLSDESLRQLTGRTGGAAVQVYFITLVYRSDHGWTVFGVGPKHLPDQIPFPAEGY